MLKFRHNSLNLNVILRTTAALGWLFLTADPLNADTIQMNDGRELKGIVVEDYKDRVILSTADGEISVMKSDIFKLQFDSEDDNLIKLAEQAQNRKEYLRAYAYYERAHKLNPASKRAKDGLVFTHGYVFRMEEVRKEEAVKRQAAVEQYGAHIHTEKSEEVESGEKAQKIKQLIGIALATGDSFPVIEKVDKDSPAEDAGLKRGDLLVSVWGRLTGYMTLREVMDILLEKPSLEIKCSIERTLDVELKGFRLMSRSPESLIGASLSMEFDGLMVSGVNEGTAALKAGLMGSDLVVAINGKPTRYLPLKEAVRLIRGTKGNKVKLTIRRECLLWRRGG